MVVYVWTAFLMVFYAANLPFCLAVDIDTQRQEVVLVGVGLFAPPKRLHPPDFHPGGPPPRLPRGAMLRAALALLKRVQIHGEATLCAGDAALTAILSGAVMALTLGRVRALPDFSEGPVRARAHGMVSVKPGHIMLAALVWAQAVISGRISVWKSMRSRAL